MEASNALTNKPPPSTQRRIELIRRLIRALANRSMHLGDIVGLLKIKPSKARNYLHYLCDENVIELDCLAAGPDSRVDRTVYRLSSEPQRIATFLIQLNTAMNNNQYQTHHYNAFTQQLHYLRGDAPRTSRVKRTPARRDPLVAALFGPARSGKRFTAQAANDEPPFTAGDAVAAGSSAPREPAPRKASGFDIPGR